VAVNTCILGFLEKYPRMGRIQDIRNRLPRPGFKKTLFSMRKFFFKSLDAIGGKVSSQNMRKCPKCSLE
jgi:hypothetical protein